MKHPPPPTRAAVALAALLAGGVAPAGSFAATAAAPLADYLPADSMIVLEVGDVGPLIEKARVHPVFSIFRDAEVRAFLAPAFDRFKDFDPREGERTLGFKEGELKELFPGNGAIAITRMVFDWDNFGTSEPTGDVVILIGFTGDDKRLEEIIEAIERHDEEEGEVKPRTVEDFGGVPIHLIEDEGAAKPFDVMAVAHAGEAIAFGTVDAVKDSLARIQGEEDSSSLLPSAAYQRFRDRVGRTDLSFFVNLKVVNAFMQRAIIEETKDQPPNPLINPATLFEQLGFTAMESLYAGVALGEGTANLHLGLGVEEVSGLLGLLAFRQGEIRLPAWVPADAVAASCALFSFPDAFAGLEKTLAGLSPMAAGLLTGQIAGLKAATGVDLRSAVFENLGREIVSFSLLESGGGEGGEPAAGAGELSDLYAVPVFDRAAMEVAIDGLVRGLTGGAEIFDQREYLGTGIRTLKPPFSGQGEDKVDLSYAFAGDHLLVVDGSPRAIEEVIAHLGRNKAGGLRDDEALLDAVERLPPDPSGVAYFNLGPFARPLFVFLAGLQGKEADSFVFCVPDALPGAVSSSLLAVVNTYAPGDGFFLQATVFNRPE